MRLHKFDPLYFLQNWRAYLTKPDEVVDLYFFSHVLNVGDLVGPYLLEKLTGKRARKNLLGLRRHYLAVGSIFHQVTAQSIVWGAGFMRENEHLRCRPLKVYLVRGALTKSKLPSDFNPALGDPALALSRFYSPAPDIANEKRTNEKRATGKPANAGQIGLVLHYFDAHLQALFAQQPNIKLINVQQQVESFVDEIVACEFIFSSSLHGLIIADAYQVRNCWIRFDSCRRADDFKYLDYFSIFAADVKADVPKNPLMINTAKPVILNNQISLCRTRSIEKHASTIINSFE